MTDPKDKQPKLFDIGPPSVVEQEVSRPRHPVWTENKAKLIQRYLRLFVMITKHGVYIDGFAGPQEPDKPEMWAAKLVIESEPRWFRKFFLFELKKTKVQQLEDLRAEQPSEPKRIIEVFSGDVNERIVEILGDSHIKQKEATFCLLDQHTFECKWATVKRLAAFKKPPENKVELFYFLAVAWTDRALSGFRSEEPIEEWWGGADWRRFKDAQGDARARLFEERFRSELGYASAKAWPIYEQPVGGRKMYYMIHATDHSEAPKLMARAYKQAVLSDQEFEQLALDFDGEQH